MCFWGIERKFSSNGIGIIKTGSSLLVEQGFSRAFPFMERYSKT